MRHRRQKLTMGTLQQMMITTLLVILLLKMDSASAKPTQSLDLLYAGGLNKDYYDLYDLLGQNLEGTEEEKAKVVDLMLQLLAEIDLPTLCEVIANDTRANTNKRTFEQQASTSGNTNTEWVNAESQGTTKTVQQVDNTPSVQTNVLPEMESTVIDSSVPSAIPFQGSQVTENFDDESNQRPATFREDPPATYKYHRDELSSFTNEPQAFEEPRKQMSKADVTYTPFPFDPTDSSMNMISKDAPLESASNSFDNKLTSDGTLSHPIRHKQGMESFVNLKLKPAISADELKQLRLHSIYGRFPSDHSSKLADEASKNLMIKSVGVERPESQLYSQALVLGDWMKEKDSFEANWRDHPTNKVYEEKGLEDVNLFGYHHEEPNPAEAREYGNGLEYMNGGNIELWQGDAEPLNSYDNYVDRSLDWAYPDDFRGRHAFKLSQDKMKRQRQWYSREEDDEDLRNQKLGNEGPKSGKISFGVPAIEDDFSGIQHEVDYRQELRSSYKIDDEPTPSTHTSENYSDDTKLNSHEEYLEMHGNNEEMNTVDETATKEATSEKSQTTDDVNAHTTSFTEGLLLSPENTYTEETVTKSSGQQTTNDNMKLDTSTGHLTTDGTYEFSFVSKDIPVSSDLSGVATGISDVPEVAEVNVPVSTNLPAVITSTSDVQEVTNLNASNRTHSQSTNHEVSATNTVSPTTMTDSTEAKLTDDYGATIPSTSNDINYDDDYDTMVVNEYKQSTTPGKEDVEPLVNVTTSTTNDDTTTSTVYGEAESEIYSYGEGGIDSQDSDVLVMDLIELISAEYDTKEANTRSLEQLSTIGNLEAPVTMSTSTIQPVSSPDQTYQTPTNRGLNTTATSGLQTAEITMGSNKEATTERTTPTVAPSFTDSPRRENHTKETQGTTLAQVNSPNVTSVSANVTVTTNQAVNVSQVSNNSTTPDALKTPTSGPTSVVKNVTNGKAASILMPNVTEHTRNIPISDSRGNVTTTIVSPTTSSEQVVLKSTDATTISVNTPNQSDSKAYEVDLQSDHEEQIQTEDEDVMTNMLEEDDNVVEQNTKTLKKVNYQSLNSLNTSVISEVNISTQSDSNNTSSVGPEMTTTALPKDGHRGVSVASYKALLNVNVNSEQNRPTASSGRIQSTVNDIPFSTIEQRNQENEIENVPEYTDYVHFEQSTEQKNTADYYTTEASTSTTWTRTTPEAAVVAETTSTRQLQRDMTTLPTTKPTTEHESFLWSEERLAGTTETPSTARVSQTVFPTYLSSNDYAEHSSVRSTDITSPEIDSSEIYIQDASTPSTGTSAGIHFSTTIANTDAVTEASTEQTDNRKVLPHFIQPVYVDYGGTTDHQVRPTPTHTTTGQVLRSSTTVRSLSDNELSTVETARQEKEMKVRKLETLDEVTLDLVTENITDAVTTNKTVNESSVSEHNDTTFEVQFSEQTILSKLESDALVRQPTQLNITVNHLKDISSKIADAKANLSQLNRNLLKDIEEKVQYEYVSGEGSFDGDVVINELETDATVVTEISTSAPTVAEATTTFQISNDDNLQGVLTYASKDSASATVNSTTLNPSSATIVVSTTQTITSAPETSTTQATTNGPETTTTSASTVPTTESKTSTTTTTSADTSTLTVIDSSDKFVTSPQDYYRGPDEKPRDYLFSLLDYADVLGSDKYNYPIRQDFGRDYNDIVPFYDRWNMGFGMSDYPMKDRYPNKPKARPYSSGFFNWPLEDDAAAYSDGDFMPSSRRMDSWKAYNMAVSDQKARAQKKKPDIHVYSDYGATLTDKDNTVGNYLWKARPWPRNMISKDMKNFEKSKMLADKLRDPITKDFNLDPSDENYEKIKEKIQRMSEQAKKAIHANQWGNRFSQGYYGRVFDDKYFSSYPVDYMAWPSSYSSDMINFDTAEKKSQDLNDYVHAEVLRNNKLNLNNYDVYDDSASSRTKDIQRNTDIMQGYSQYYEMDDSSSKTKLDHPDVDHSGDQTKEDQVFENVASNPETKGVSYDFDPKKPDASPGTVVDDFSQWSDGLGTVRTPSGGVPAPEDYKCPGLFGYHRDPKDCQSFFICSWGMAYRVVCPPGTLWNPKQAVCDWAVNVRCPVNQDDSSHP